MANADLERFMVERLLELDPTLSDSEGSRMFTVVIAPLVKRLGVDPIAVDAEAFITERINDSFPELDIASPGSTLKDTLVRPMILLLEPIKREIEFLRLQRSVADPLVLTEDEMDAILANVFAERREGAFARGKVRVFYNSPRSVSIDNSIIFSTAESLGFVPDEIRTFQPSEMRRSGNLFFLDMAIRSIEPIEEANVAINEIRFVQNLDGVVRVTNPAPIRFGVSRETNQTFFERADASLTERTLNTDRGVQANLLSNFTDLVSVEVIGYGEPEMQRDIIRGVVDVVEEELIGSMVHMTAEFQTEAAFNLGQVAADTIVMPFTNIIRVKDPFPLPVPENDPTRVAIRNSIANATFIRVADGNGHYQGTLVSRVRRVVQVTDAAVSLVGTDQIIRLADFEIFPGNADEASPSDGGFVVTNSLEHGYNKYTVQGSSFELITEDDNTDYILGAPLPFTDTCSLQMGAADRPASVIFGRDFLVLADVTPPSVSAVHLLPNVMRVLPMDRLQAGNVLSVARADAMLIAKERIAYPGQASFVYQPTPDVLAVTERVRVIDFGTPKYKALDATRYDGISKDAWARNPGVQLQAIDRVGGGWTAATIGTEAKYLNVILEPTQVSWAARGVSVGQFISLAVFRGVPELPAPPDGTEFDGTLAESTNDLRWQAWGQIIQILAPNTLRVRGADIRSLNAIGDVLNKDNFDVANGRFPLSTFRAAWTVYEGQSSLVAPDGRLVTSYDDFAFLPAYKLAEVPPAPPAEGICFAPFVSSFFNEVIQDKLNEPFTDIAQHKAFWIRLEKPLTDILPSLAVPAPQLTEDAAVVIFDIIPSNDVVDIDYQKDKYTTSEAVEISDGLTKDGLVQAVGNPETEGALSFNPLSAADWPQAGPAVANTKQLLGFLLPHPMGKMHVAPGARYELLGGTSQTLENQVLQFFNDRRDEVDFEAILTISDIPGGVPFPNQFPPGLIVKNDEVHVGGLTDVYVKLSSEETRTTSAITLTPRDLLDRREVLTEGGDGQIDFANGKQDFISPSLDAFLADRFGIVGTAHLHNLAIQLVESPVDVQPKAFRILNNIPNGVRIDGLFAGGGGGVLPNVRWRLVEQLTTDLEAPHEVLQQGTDMIVETGSFTARIPSGITFSDSVTSRELLILIDSGPNRGEYPVTSKGAVTLGTDTAFLAAESAAPFRVIARQPALVEIPLVRLTAVSLTGEFEGTVIPYRLPVDAEATSFAGLNDDPLTDDDPSLNEGILFSDGINPATFKIPGPPPPNAWADLGILKFDVLRLDGVPDDLKYWSVIGVDQDEDGNPEVGSLLLDRVIAASSRTNIGFTIGHPSLGTATVRFIDRTLFEVDQNSRFSFVSDAGATFSFRPTLAESSEIFRSPHTIPVATSLAPGNLLEFADVNIFSHGVEIGDRVDVLSEVLESNVHLVPTVAVSGKSFIMSFDDARRVVVFTGTEPSTLSQITADINRQASDVVRASISGDKILLASRQHMRLLDEGTAGILDLLQFPVAQRDSKSDVLKFKSFLIDSLAFNEVNGVSTITLDGNTVVDPVGLFIDIIRVGVQRFYPGNLGEEATGLFTAEVKLSSYDPLEIPAVVVGQQLEIEGFKSFGYELVVENNNYSYSLGERVAMRSTPVILGEFDTSLDQALTVVGTGVTIEYDRAPQVRAIQEHMLLRSIRVQCHNPLVRHFQPAYPVLSIVYQGNVPQIRVEEAISSFLNSLFPNRPLDVFDLLGVIRDLGVTHVTLPQEAGFLVHDENRRLRIVRSLDTVFLGPQTHVMGATDSIRVFRQ